MKIQYHKQDDILSIQFSNAPIVKDISYGWNVNMGFTADGLGQITVLDAQANGLLPVEVDDDLYGVIRHLRAIPAQDHVSTVEETWGSIPLDKATSRYVAEDKTLEYDAQS